MYCSLLAVGPQVVVVLRGLVIRWCRVLGSLVLVIVLNAPFAPLVALFSAVGHSLLVPVLQLVPLVPLLLCA